jgi:hypothetical protein
MSVAARRIALESKGGVVMVLFARTNLPIARLFLILATITFAVISTPTHAEQPAKVPERESLRGLVGAEVVVEPLNIQIEDQGLQTLMLQSSIKQRLQKAGVKVLTERERLASPTAALLVARVDALHDRIGRYFYSNDLLLTQRVRVEGIDASELSAVTWMKLGGIGIVADDNVKHIEEQVLHKVDQFIKDYLAVNPDRRANN